METLAAQPQQGYEYDYQHRIRVDSETWLAEVLNGSMRTPFEYTTDGQELYAEDGGALREVFDGAINEAERLKAKTPELGFELRRRNIERGEYDDMLAMVQGKLPNTMVVVSDFPAELQNAREDIGGYNVTRKQTMLRVITYRDGKLTMYSQTLDGSNRTANEAIYARFNQVAEAGELLGQRIHTDIPAENQPMLVDSLTSVYDRSMITQLGGEWYAGRPEPKHDTYSFVRQQHELINRFVACQQVGGITSEERYNIAALLSKRFEAAKHTGAYDIHSDASVEQFMGSVLTHSLDWELHQAGKEARTAGQTFSGCGATERARASAEAALEESGYGNQSQSGDEDKFGSLTFKCKKGHSNRRPRGRLITSCWVPGCKDSVGC